jgi:hypothetical protein
VDLSLLDQAGALTLAGATPTITVNEWEPTICQRLWRSMVATLVIASTAANMVGGTISFGGGTLQYNQNPGTDYSAQFSTAANQQYRINVITAAGPTVELRLSPPTCRAWAAP